MDLSKYKAKPNKTIRQHTDDLLKNLEILYNFAYIKEKNLYKLIKKACEYHDYGKSNKEFQKRIDNKSKFNENTEIAHNVLSLYFIDELEFEDINDYYRIAFAVLNHHSYCDNIRMVQGKEYKELINSLLEGFETFAVSRGKSTKIAEMVTDEVAILIKGYLHKCDFSASGNFVIEHKNNFLVEGLENLLLEWKKSKENAKWNDLQLFCKKNRENNIIVVAETGMGKTEAGLHWIGDSKGFFILPLRTAINSIYDRVKNDILKNKMIDSRLALLHSDSLSYYQNSNQEMDILDYHTRSKQLAMPLSISTLDQLFDFVFKYQGYELKLTTLSYSKVIIDEIQMYSADLLAYLVFGLRLINKYGGKVGILTATLAPFVRDFLTNGEDPIDFEMGTFISDKKRHNINTFDYRINEEDIYEKFIFNRRLKVSNKILVVCNTVKKAQELYLKLSEMEGIFPGDLNILHSKFIKKDRGIKEKEILEFGKTETIGECIWISTQVVEASLDIDFDYLFTELADISSLFQRLGRCNRKGLKSIKETNCFVYLEINRNLLTNGDKGFIDKKIYEISREALENYNGVLSEQEKVDMINTNLTTKKIKGTDYWKKYMKFYSWVRDLTPYEIDKKDAMLRNIVSYDVIPKLVYEENKLEIDDYSKKIISGDIDVLEKVQCKEGIMKYTVAVGIYDVYCKGRSLIVNTIPLSKYYDISVVSCNYTELGFSRLSNNNNNFDNFL